MNRIVKFLEQRPGLAILVSFLTIILVGTILLMLPCATQNGIKTNFIDACFTATSAVCVTGLIVRDTALHWSRFGQIIILVLIQLGSLAVITAYINIFMMFTNVKDKMLEDVSRNSNVFKQRIKKILLESVCFAFVIETFLIMYFYFLASFKPFDAVFHAVSAFANAGFSTYSNSLMDYANSLTITVPVMTAIIIGGLGFPIWRYFLSLIRLDEEGARYKRYSIMVIITTIILICAGFLLIYAFEGFGGREKILTALFQSITARTAGFNTVAINQLSQASHLVLMALMFVGGAWGSSAGGIKVFTFIILSLFVYSFLWKRKDNELIILDRSIPEEFIRSIFLVVTISIFIVFMITLALIYTEKETLNIVLFEVISAFNNVGLTLGLANHLSLIGKILIIALMLFGRIGPLTLILKIRKKAKKSTLNYPPENSDNLLM